MSWDGACSLLQLDGVEQEPSISWLYGLCDEEHIDMNGVPFHLPHHSRVCERIIKYFIELWSKWNVWIKLFILELNILPVTDFTNRIVLLIKWSCLTGYKMRRYIDSTMPLWIYCNYLYIKLLFVHCFVSIIPSAHFNSCQEEQLSVLAINFYYIAFEIVEANMLRHLIP